MRTTSRGSLLVMLSTTLLICASAASYGQNREKFVISAKAGGINAVTGRSRVHLKGGSDWQQLSVTDDLDAGDVVRTDSDGRIEMLLNPGSYLRLGADSEFELVNNSLDNLEIRLLRGTAIVEATGTDETELMISIITPHTRMAIVRRGLYRVNVVPGDATELIVRKGRVMLNDSHTKVKGGNKVVFSATSFSVAKLDNADKKKVDDFDSWSKQRAEMVAQANRKLTGRDLNQFLASFNDDWSRHFFGGSSGVWLFNPRYGCYTFVPFYIGWGSPYGSSYSSGFYRDYYCCGNPTYGGGSVAGNGSGGSTSGSGGHSGVSSNPPPPPPSQSMPTMRETPPAATGKIQRANDPQP